MEQEGINKTTAFMFVAFVIALIIGLLGIILAIFNVFRPGSVGFSLSAATPERQQPVIAQPAYTTTKTQINYAFELPNPTIFTDDGTETVDLINQMTAISPQFKLSGSNLARIRIPDIKVSAPVAEGFDGSTALNKGFWLYTPSFKENGEKIFLCHRRHWGANHPFSCWYLDRLKVGAQVLIDTTDGRTLTYQVMSSTQLPASELTNVVRLSQDNVIKIITCAPLGSSTDRLVVIAKLIN
jgi:LPXTG-site transpeptidase (sortase) family protein